MGIRSISREIENFSGSEKQRAFGTGFFFFLSKMSDYFNVIEFQKLKNAVSLTDNH